MSYICNPVDLWNYLGCLRALDHGISPWLGIEIFPMVYHFNKVGASAKYQHLFFFLNHELPNRCLDDWNILRKEGMYILLTVQCLKCCDFVSFAFHYLLIKYDFHWCYPNYIMHTIPQWNTKSVCAWQ